MMPNISDFFYEPLQNEEVIKPKQKKILKISIKSNMPFDVTFSIKKNDILSIKLSKK